MIVMAGLLWKSGLGAAGFVLLLGSVAASAEDGTVILRGARILTMDDAKPEASAIALVDGRIAAVGSEEDVAPYLNGATIYDLPAEALVLPGFHDDHNHLIWSATEAKDVGLWEVVDKDGVREAIEAANIDSLPDGAWIRGAGWDIAAFPDANAAILDEVTGDRPMFVSAVDGHSGWANSAAMKAAGIDAGTKDPEGGRIERDAQGNATGLLRESAMELVSKLLPEYPHSQVDAGFEEAQAEALSYGITAIIDPSADDWMLDGYKRADEAGNLVLRVEAAVKIEAAEGPEGVKRVLDWKQRYASPHLEHHLHQILRRWRHRNRNGRVAGSLCRQQ